MRKRLLMLLMLLCVTLSALCLSVSADSYASNVDATCTVDSDGNCSVYLKANVHLEVADGSVTFPLPSNATNITLNGSSVSTVKNNASIGVYLDKVTAGMAGDFALQFTYNLPKSVKANSERQLVLTVPLLCGFSYPIQNFTFVVNMQGAITERPDFYSTYRQDAILSDLEYNVDGGMLTGAIKRTMNDHEALSMTMVVDKDLFPTISTYQRTGNPEIIPMAVFGGIALLYWLLFLRTWFPRAADNTVPPEGISAGELGCRLTLAGGDLTMMVLTWAQLGYLLIHLDGRGRVLLYKRMDMGNERSLFEIRVFNTLFGRSDTVDATGSAYAKLCRKTAAMVPGEQTAFLSSSKSVRIFRGICCVSQLFCGICMAMNLSGITALQILLAVILGGLGLPTAWLMQSMAYRMHLRGKGRVYAGLGSFAFWMVIGLLAKVPLIPLCVCLGEMLMGVLAAYGGRRSALNRMEVSQILGLRAYLRRFPQEDVRHLLAIDPDYFFRMLPYALAMGVEKPFCKAFGERKLQQCPYLSMRDSGKRTAEEWGWIFNIVARRMDKRYKQMEVDKWLIIRFR